MDEIFTPEFLQLLADEAARHRAEMEKFCQEQRALFAATFGTREED